LTGICSTYFHPPSHARAISIRHTGYFAFLRPGFVSIQIQGLGMVVFMIFSILHDDNFSVYLNIVSPKKK